MKTKIEAGYTNISYKENNTFFQIKKENKFNHKIDYNLLENFDFVPKLIENTKESIRFEWIEGEKLQVNDSNIRNIAQIMKKIHNSKLPFPQSNHAARVKHYQNILRERNINIPVINEYYRKINLILKNMKKDTPLHNDLWPQNMIQDGSGKIWLVDWEYATKGDKHFELAYFIEASNLTDEQETIFLKEYDDYDYEYVLQHRILVLYLVILWCNSQDVKPFDDQPFIDRIKNVSQILKARKKEWK
ncbi:phosphotransferase [Mesomycoplasma neurolyticum]|uniref:Thiamine kinase n=1 Tax=Mesomycoplasma neurolyticum TaxID=2120 RepID=A0A449A598_9BACT|nr:phosphotransferase [Mesomycoplasma neurolyticum]VEU59441.1 thiamine kinase [Mesomycoplasma neurolyticum]